MWGEEDKLVAEENIENALSYFLHDKRSPDKDQKWKRKAEKAIKFLQEEFPNSYAISLDISIMG